MFLEFSVSFCLFLLICFYRSGLHASSVGTVVHGHGCTVLRACRMGWSERGQPKRRNLPG